MLPNALFGCSLVLSNLKPEVDHFAIGYLDKHSGSQLKMLLPLGFNSMASAQRALEAFEFAQISSDDTDTREPVACDAIRRAAAMLSGPGLASPGHILFISARQNSRVFMPLVDENISIHTMSPDFRFEFENRVPRGWHVFSNGECHGNRHAAKQLFRSRIHKMMRHMRTGFDSGIVTNLQVHLAARDGGLVREVWGRAPSWMSPARVRDG